MKHSTFTTIVKQDDDGELYIDLPHEVMDQLGWSNYDDLEWIIEDNGKILLRKRKDDSSNEA